MPIARSSYFDRACRTEPPHILVESAKLTGTLLIRFCSVSSALRARAATECARIDLTTNLELNINTPADAPQPTVIDIRYGQMGLVQVRIRTTDPGAILDELTGRIATAPQFFRRTAVCLDLGALKSAPDVAEVRTVIDAIRRAGMLVIGLAGDAAEMETVSNGLNLPVLSGFRAPRHPVADVPPAPPAPASTEFADPGLATLIQHQTVRSGQRIYARNRDLIVTAGIGAGAEVMADGCLASGEMMSVDDVKEILGLDVIGVVPESSDVLSASNAGAPVILNVESDASRAYEDAVARLLGDTLPLRFVEEPKRSFFARMFGG
jgi:septum site-determining protein MinC